MSIQNTTENLHQNGIREILSGQRLIPVVTFNSVDEAIPTMEKLMAKGVNCIEITLRTSCAIDCMSALRSRYGKKILIGAGTVINNEQVNLMTEKQTDFLVSPGFSEKLLDSMQRSGIPYLPGVATPGEIISAIDKNCFTLKFFPANLFGGHAAIKTYSGIFPQVKFCPTGGISEENYNQFLQLPNVISVGGSWMV